MQNYIELILKRGLRNLDDDTLKQINDDVNNYDISKFVNKFVEKTLSDRNQNFSNLIKKFNNKYFYRYQEDDFKNLDIEIVSFSFDELNRNWIIEQYFMSSYSNGYAFINSNQDTNVYSVEILHEWTDKIYAYKEIGNKKYQEIKDIICSFVCKMSIDINKINKSLNI